MAYQIDGSPSLIPGLPNDVASLILSLLPFSHLARVKPTCKSWRHFLTRHRPSPTRRRPSHLLCVFPGDPSVSPPYLFDPKHLAWLSLPTLPPNPSEYGLCNFSAVANPISAVDHRHVYLIGGSLFDARSFPLDRPSSSSSAYRLDLADLSWSTIAPMNTPRGSFACAAVPGRIVVAGGGSRHAVFGAAGSRIRAVEAYNIALDEWEEIEGLPGFRAGGAGFVRGGEFWVMGGYGESRTVSGVFPVDRYYRDAVAMELEGGGWREVGEMWEEGERERLGKVVVVEEEDEEGGGEPGVFMLDGVDIFRYDMGSNRWQKESSVPRKAPQESSFGFVVLDGELHVMMTVKGFYSSETRRSRQHKRAGTLFIQIYNPRKKTWRSLVSKPPFYSPLDFNTAVMCAVHI